VDGIGSKKRCGGIGDILSGCISACINWNYEYGTILACHVTKLAAQLAFEKHGRSLTGLGVLDFVEEAVQRI
jgi:NAD(P)H-hydrate repair Nnr-like enzyme with NAD(P)H-hydrate dehydratase domain